jgi:hypothetical protein
MNKDEAFDAVERDFRAAQTLDAISALTGEQRDRLHEYWVDRARGELTTALTFEFMLADLEIEAAPRELIALAKTAIADEHRHVDWCLRWARLVAPTRPVEPELSGTRPLELEGASARDNRLLRTVFGCCFSETVAIHVLRGSHAHITLPSVRRLNHEHMKEEVGHARLGWALVAWPGLTARDRSMLAAYVPEMLRLVRMVWQSTQRAPDSALHELGYLSSEIIGPACDEAIDGVVVPGLESAGIAVTAT